MTDQEMLMLYAPGNEGAARIGLIKAVDSTTTFTYDRGVFNEGSTPGATPFWRGPTIMLQELTIRNFAIIEDLNIHFDSGLTILSGETGAGKSIIINAISLLLGSRASTPLIRTGAENAELEALFQIQAGGSAARVMEALGYDPSEGLLIRRIIARNERHRIYINGRLGTIQNLTAITEHLANISGQHAHQGLLKEEQHLAILDQFGGLSTVRDTYAAAFRQMVPLVRKRQELIQRKNRQVLEVELLRHQHLELEAAAVLPDEDRELETERLRLRHAESLYQTAQRCVDELYSGEGAVMERLGGMAKALTQAGRIDDRLIPSAEQLADLSYRIEDLAAHLRDYLKHIELDPGRLDEVESRLDLLNRIKRKYGGSLAAVIASKDSVAEQLRETANIDEVIEEVDRELTVRHGELCRLASGLSEARREAGEALARQVEAELASLRMSGTRMEVDLPALPASDGADPFFTDQGRTLSENGAERAVFMIAPNVGENIKPLAATASGGELSRVVLALKAILAQSDALETVVFDEVDAGIGGEVAEVVGRKLSALAQHHQILCITHLPQIARHGRHHFRIAKTVTEGRTLTTIAPLRGDERVTEIARMLGGEKITATTLQHAGELLAGQSPPQEIAEA
jgi:DNA repair protein RecN (Recombination protein N)